MIEFNLLQSTLNIYGLHFASSSERDSIFFSWFSFSNFKHFYLISLSIKMIVPFTNLPFSIAKKTYSLPFYPSINVISLSTRKKCTHTVPIWSPFSRDSKKSHFANFDIELSHFSNIFLSSWDSRRVVSFKLISSIFFETLKTG